MNKAEVAQVLTMIAAFDRRTLGEADVEAWHLILEPVEQPDAMQAVRDHFAQSTAWLMPAHVMERARGMADRRLGRLKIAENQTRDEQETRALTAVAEPVDREALKRRLQAGAIKGGKSVPKVDRRADSTKAAEARAELERLRTERQGDAS